MQGACEKSLLSLRRGDRNFTFLFSTFLTASASRQSLVRAGRVPVSWRASALTGAKKSITIDQLVPVANTGSRMLLSDARVQIAHPKADLTDPSACWRFALSEIYLLLARTRAHTQARELSLIHI